MNTFRVWDITTELQHKNLADFVLKNNLKSQVINKGYYVTVPNELTEEFYKITGQYREKCPECGAYDNHSPNCTLIDFNTALKKLKEYHTLYNNMQESVEFRYKSENNNLKQQRDRYKVELLKYKAKFFEVKHENNQLRKKLVKI
jgi:DNA polymerase III delta prime subunit